MLYNKNKFQKENDKKVLRKVKKQWVTVSLATFMLLGGASFTVGSTTVNADATPAKTEEPATQKSDAAKPASDVPASSDGQEPSNYDELISNTFGNAKSASAGSHAVSSASTESHAVSSASTESHTVSSASTESHAVSSASEQSQAPASSTSDGSHAVNSTSKQSQSPMSSFNDESRSNNEKKSISNLEDIRSFTDDESVDDN
ncbi:hypothetical protein R4B61_01325 [Fructilactobacillus vespulae]|uniref:hypothetical protein n=1 Tax=Fructilactobacillus vespulae TaxID=1249630 RepID=UPI0039B40039